MRLFRIFEQFPRTLVHPKVWGYEVWFFNTDELCMKLLVIYPGYTCSYHTHSKKYEIFMALDSDEEGLVVMNLEGKQSFLKQGEHVVIERGMAHDFQVRGKQPGSLLEFSTHHLEDDSYRLTVSRLLALGGSEMPELGEVGKFHGVKVLCAGDLMYDTYWDGPSVGLSPEAPCAEVLNPTKTSRPGGLGNVASNILSLGGSAIVVGAVGKDRDGGELLNIMADEGVNLDYVLEIRGRPTTSKLRIMSGSHHHVRLSHEHRSDIVGEHGAALANAFDKAIKNETIDVIYFADYDKGVLSEKFLANAISVAKDQILPTIADPKLAHPWAYKGVNIYKPNVGRLATTLDMEIVTESDVEKAADRIRMGIKPDYSLITRGPHGMSLFDYGKAMMTHIPARLVQVSELSGAGDTVGAVLALAIGAGLDIERAAEIANVAGSLVVQKAGTATCTPFELSEALAASP